MKRALLILLTGLFVMPSTVEAKKTFKRLCGGSHFVRAAGTEIATTAYSIRNGNLDDSVTLRRLTIRDAFGTVLWDSDGSAAFPHPLNPDFDPDLDITVVPPGGSYPIATNHIWNLDAIDGPVAHANSISTLFELSTDGKPELVLVGGSLRVWARAAPGTERSRSPVACVDVK